MRFTTVIPVLGLAAGLVNAAADTVFDGSLTLSSNLVQDTGNGLANAEAGQAASLTSNNDFLDFCSGKTLTNGLQDQQGSCNPIPMGDIPAKDKMISAAFVEPQNGQIIAANSPINFTVQLTNLNAGVFTNPDDTYYAAPQQIGANGAVIGHTHITVQDIGDINTSTPPDPTIFAFFKGINDAGNGNGLLSANLTAGLPAGAYRVCSMTSASNHQPVLMPVAQRGAQDDCVRFQAKDIGGNAGNAGNAASSVAASSVAATSAAAQSTAAAGGNAAGGKGGQRFGKGGRFGRPRKFTAREFIA